MTLGFVGKTLFDSYTLSPLDLLPLRQVSRQHSHMRATRAFFEEYLRRYENSLGTEPGQRTWAIFRHFHAAQLQRLFIRKVLLMICSEPGAQACVAGSYAVYVQTLISHGTSPWQPGDINIFLTHEDDKAALYLHEKITALYRDSVSDPLHLQLSSTIVFLSLIHISEPTRPY